MRPAPATGYGDGALPNPHLIRILGIVILIAVGLTYAFEYGGYWWLGVGVFGVAAALNGTRRGARIRAASSQTRR